MSKYNIPTARYANFTSYEKAKAHLESIDYRVVLKASGLALGKGVLIPETKEEALEGLKEIMVSKAFGKAGEEIVIEEFLEGQEISVLAFCDGYTVLPLPAAQDHKRIGEGDTGLNTGGMGTYSPAPVSTPEIQSRIMKEVLQPTLDGMRKEGYPFVGMLFTGFMISPKGKIDVLEYNVRFGDPETQSLLALMDEECDLAEILMVSCQLIFLRHLLAKCSILMVWIMIGLRRTSFGLHYPQDEGSSCRHCRYGIWRLPWLIRQGSADKHKFTS